MLWQTKHRLQLNPTNQASSVCGKEVDYNVCPAINIWEFDDNSCHVKISHNGYHTCEARKPFREAQEVNNKISQDRCTVKKATKDAIIDCLKESKPSWENMSHISDSTMEKQKLCYAEKKSKAEKRQYGHGLDAHTALRSELFSV